MYGTDFENQTVEPGKKKKGLLFKLLAVILCGILFGASAAAAFLGINAMTKSDAALTSLNTSESGQTARQSAIRLSAVSYSAGESSLSQSLDVSDVKFVCLLGIKGEDITASISSSYGIPQGVYVTSLDADSPLKAAGVTVKSVVTHFDGIRVTSFSNLEKRLRYYAAGETVDVTVQVIEGGEYVEKTVSVTLGRAADHAAAESGGSSRYGRP